LWVSHSSEKREACSRKKKERVGFNKLDVGEGNDRQEKEQLLLGQEEVREGSRKAEKKEEGKGTDGSHNEGVRMEGGNCGCPKGGPRREF